MTRLADPKNLLLNLGHSLETNLDSEIASSYHDDNDFSAHCHKANEFGRHPRQPIGVVGGIVTWNYPFVLASWKVAPALAAGCTIILKPAEQTPLTALRLAELCDEAGLPPGVVNILTGFGETAGAALAQSNNVDKVSFTGSVDVAKKIVQFAMGNLKRITLELGGKSPNIIFSDTDLESAIPAAATTIFRNTGQVCCAGSRLYVEKQVFDRVVGGVAERAKAMKLGAAFNSESEIGPLMSKAQLNRVQSYVHDGNRGRGKDPRRRQACRRGWLFLRTHRSAEHHANHEC
jgi:phenylacetaldehyde dehydrogenase